MTFVVVDALSLPGDAAKPNEDAFGHDERAALVMDGATMLGDGLMPGPSDAAWIAQFGTRRWGMRRKVSRRCAARRPRMCGRRPAPA